MSVSLLELIQQAGFDPIRDEHDATWLLSKQSEFEELVEKAQELIDRIEEAKDKAAEAEYKKSFPEEDN